jgi:hypothetical protein
MPIFPGFPRPEHADEVRPEHRTEVVRSSRPFAPEAGGASKKDFIANGGAQPNSGVRDRQGRNAPGHGGSPAPRRDPMGTGPKGRAA